MLTNITQQFIQEQLNNFLIGPRCCQQICGSFLMPEQIFLTQQVIKLGCYTAPYVHNGVQTVKICKRSCLHFVEKPVHIQLQPNSAKDLMLLHERGSFLGSPNEMQVSPDVFNLGNSRPVVPPHRFSIGPLKQSMVRMHSRGQRTFQLNCNLLPYKQYLLEALKRNRVLVVNGESSFNNSTSLPMYIIENCFDCHAHCKIICVEREQLLAIYKSERLAEYLGEKVGNTVAFQVHLQSRISETSNLIYTTASFLLRVLMGQSTVDSFRHISHVIVGDVHLHEAYADLLLCELRTAIRYHTHLRIVLLSNSLHNSEFLNYFGEGEEVRLKLEDSADIAADQQVNVLYLSDIQKLISTHRLQRSPLLAHVSAPRDFQNFGSNRQYLDRCLDVYERSGSEQAFETFLYMIHTEYASIDYKHSISGSTAVMIAGKLGKSTHLRTMLELHADPLIVDEQNMNAMANAVSGGNSECIELLNNYCCEGSLPSDTNAAFFDATLVTDLLRLLLTHCDWKPGNILVFAPDFDHLVRLNFSILRDKSIGNIPQHVSISMLHSNIEKDQLDSLIESNSVCIKIILATDMAETIDFLNSITYVIDSVRTQRVFYNAESDCKESKVVWISRENLDSRASLVCRSSDKRGTCFRLISRTFVDKLPRVRTPELLTIPLDRVCLTVKLLSHHTMVAEYLQNTIVCPPFINVHHTVEYLKKIDIFDELEDVTWLGCRLIDVPVECQLGKLLVLAILLQCLDPILTIVSFLSTADPLKLPTEIDGILQPYISIIRHKMKQERNRLAEGNYADPLIYLRLYQEWQNELRDENPTMALLDEHHFAMNAILERVCDMRTHLVGALRSSQLIHNQGHLSMHYINLKSNSWPMIKAALVGGLYPKICLFDKFVSRLKSNRAKELVVHPSSVLRELVFQPINISAQYYKSPWIVYADECGSVFCNSISCCTLITPVSIVLFAGPSKINLSNMITQNSEIEFSKYGSLISTLCLDDWMSFTMDSAEAQLVLKTRQYFYSTYINYLQHCGSVDKWRRANVSFTQIPRLFDTIEKVLTEEDLACGFEMLENVGLRPKAMPNRFLVTYNTAINMERGSNPTDTHTTTSSLTTHTHKNKMMYPAKLLLNIQKFLLLEKQFFMVYLSNTTDVVFRKYSNEWLREPVAKILGPVASSDKLTYVIMYNKNPDQFCAVGTAKWFSGIFKLEERFKNKIPIFELINICLKNNICIPTFNERRAAFQIDKRVGNIILDLFAFRNNWLYN